jgi:MFS family permease
MGIAMGLLFLAPLTVVAHYFRQRRALMMGVVMSGSATGGLVFPIMLNQLFHNPSIGFAWGVRAAAFLTSGLLAISCLLMKTRLPNRRQREKMGIKTPKLDYLAILTDPPQFFTTLGYVTSREGGFH